MPAPSAAYPQSPMAEKDIAATEPVTFDELRRFARDWRRYSRWLKEGNNQYKAVAYLGVSPSTDYPAEVVRWADEHGWAADRFFLLEQKFRLTLSNILQDEKRKNMTRHLQAQIDAVRRDTTLSPEQKRQKTAQYYRGIRSVKDATQTKTPVTPEEYELIKLNRNALEKILQD